MQLLWCAQTTLADARLYPILFRSFSHTLQAWRPRSFFLYIISDNNYNGILCVSGCMYSSDTNKYFDFYPHFIQSYKSFLIYWSKRKQVTHKLAQATFRRGHKRIEVHLGDERKLFSSHLNCHTLTLSLSLTHTCEHSRGEAHIESGLRNYSPHLNN
jgi:hypothetical protein